MMEELVPYIPTGIFVAAVIFMKVELNKRPTFKETDKRYTNKEVCLKEHEGVNEKLNCIPEIKDTVTEIKTKIDIFLQENGK